MYTHTHTYIHMYIYVLPWGKQWSDRRWSRGNNFWVCRDGKWNNEHGTPATGWYCIVGTSLLSTFSNDLRPDPLTCLGPGVFMGIPTSYDQIRVAHIISTILVSATLFESWASQSISSWNVKFGISYKPPSGWGKISLKLWLAFRMASVNILRLTINSFPVFWLSKILNFERYSTEPLKNISLFSYEISVFSLNSSDWFLILETKERMVTSIELLAESFFTLTMTLKFTRNQKRE